jgi:Cold shock proteins
MKGIVKKFDVSKGYGFIVSESEEKDIFFHYSQIQSSGFKTVNEGEEVDFELVESERGKQAYQIYKKD